MLKHNALPFFTVALNVLIIVAYRFAFGSNFSEDLGYVAPIVGFTLSFSLTVLSVVLLSSNGRPIWASAIVVSSFALCSLVLFGASAAVR